MSLFGDGGGDSRTGMLSEAPELKLPPLRTFRVIRPNEANIEVVAHSVSQEPDGSLSFVRYQRWANTILPMKTRILRSYVDVEELLDKVERQDLGSSSLIQ
jgi:hypothetical protein